MVVPDSKGSEAESNASIERDEADVVRVLEDAMVPALDEEPEGSVHDGEVDPDTSVQAEITIVDAETADEVGAKGACVLPNS